MGFTTPAAAQPAPPDGLYEDFPCIFMQPSAPLTGAPTLLPRWVDVRTVGRETTVTFEPEARVVLRIVWGPSGAIDRRLRVDDAESIGPYVDDSGAQLAHCTGYAWTRDSSDEIVAGTATWRGPMGTPVHEHIDVARGPHEIVVTRTRDERRLRRDRYDTSRRLLETRFYDEASRESARLTYVRDAHGALTRVSRRLGPRRGVADATRPDARLRVDDVGRIASVPIEAHEIFLLLGAPTRTDDEGRGSVRRVRVEFAGGLCWMHEPPSFVLDASGHAERAFVSETCRPHALESCCGAERPHECVCPSASSGGGR